MAAEKDEVVSILGATIAKNVLEQAGRRSAKKREQELEESEDEHEEEDLPTEKKPQATLFDFGG